MNASTFDKLVALLRKYYGANAEAVARQLMLVHRNFGCTTLRHIPRGLFTSYCPDRIVLHTRVRGRERSLPLTLLSSFFLRAMLHDRFFRSSTLGTSDRSREQRFHCIRTSGQAIGRVRHFHVR